MGFFSSLKHTVSGGFRIITHPKRIINSISHIPKKAMFIPIVSSGLKAATPIVSSGLKAVSHPKRIIKSISHIPRQVMPIVKGSIRTANSGIKLATPIVKGGIKTAIPIVKGGYKGLKTVSKPLRDITGRNLNRFDSILGNATSLLSSPWFLGGLVIVGGVILLK